MSIRITVARSLWSLELRKITLRYFTSLAENTNHRLSVSPIVLSPMLAFSARLSSFTLYFSYDYSIFLDTKSPAVGR